MDAAQLFQLAITASILLLVFALGMRATFADATSFFRELFLPPHSLVRALLAMNLVVPIIAASVASAFDLKQAVKVALVAMAIAPVPPILPGTQLKSGARASYVYGLLVAVSLTAIVTIPLTIAVLAWLFGRELRIGFADLAKPIGVTIFLPLVAGLTFRSLAPAFAERAAPWVSRLGTALLVAGFVPFVVPVWPVIVALVGNGTILAIAAVVVAAIAVGHGLGGPDPGERTALGIASAMRHPGVALTIARVNFPDNNLVPGAIMLFVVVGAIATTLYAALRQRVHRTPGA